MSEPILFCFAGPTASGKSTICNALLKDDPDLLLSISTTTRAPRAGEEDGREYFFVSEDEFEQRVADDCFIEHAAFSGNRYGTEKRNIERAAEAGADLLLDIEVQGVQQLKKLYPGQVTTVFVFPVSFSEMKKRLLARGTESEKQVEQRLETAKSEVKTLSEEGFSDYFLVNDKLETAIAQAKAIVSACRLEMGRVDASSIKKL